MNHAIAEMRRIARSPKTPRPNLRAIYYRDSHAPTLVVFEVPAGVTTRSAVELLGAPRYARVGASKWRLFYGDAVWCAINGDASWSSNPWVWRIEFKRVEVTCG